MKKFIAFSMLFVLLLFWFGFGTDSNETIIRTDSTGKAVYYFSTPNQNNFNYVAKIRDTTDKRRVYPYIDCAHGEWTVKGEPKEIELILTK